jgi:hypothetical protein
MGKVRVKTDERSPTGAPSRYIRAGIFLQRDLEPCQGNVRKMTQSADPTMEEVINSFAPLVGELVWQARRGHGSFLTMEFGWPHLLVREPISAVHSVSARVRRNLERRAVAIVGDWHFWVQPNFAHWHPSH